MVVNLVLVIQICLREPKLRKVIGLKLVDGLPMLYGTLISLFIVELGVVAKARLIVAKQAWRRRHRILRGTLKLLLEDLVLLLISLLVDL